MKIMHKGDDSNSTHGDIIFQAHPFHFEDLLTHYCNNNKQHQSLIVYENDDRNNNNCKQFNNKISYGIDLPSGDNFDAWKQQIEKKFDHLAKQLRQGQNVIFRAPTVEEFNKYKDLYTNPKKLNNIIQHFYGFQQNMQDKMIAIQCIQTLIDTIKPLAKQILRIDGYSVIPNKSTINWPQYQQLMNQYNNNNTNKRKHSDKEEMDQDTECNNNDNANEQQAKVNNNNNNNLIETLMMQDDDGVDHDEDNMSISDDGVDEENANDGQNEEINSLSIQTNNTENNNNNTTSKDFNVHVDGITHHLCTLINKTYDGSQHTPQGTLYGLLRSC